MTYFVSSLPWSRLSVLLFVFCASFAVGRESHPDTANTFRWIHPNSDPQLWEQVLKSFSDELSPDEPSQGQDRLDIYRYKYLAKGRCFESFRAGYCWPSTGEKK
jgi:hypothetical protein